MRTNYVLIDYENVQPHGLAVLDEEHFKLIVFIGANQTKVAFETAVALQRMGRKATYVKISGVGSNALDFHIAFYIGKIATEDPTAYFHIISNDSGFDPLIAYLKTQKIPASRCGKICDIPIVKANSLTSSNERVNFIIANLRQRGESKPRTVKALSSTIASMFQKQLPVDEVPLLVKELQSRQIIMLDNTKISYELPR